MKKRSVIARTPAYPAAVAIEIDAADEVFLVGPPAGALERAVTAARSDVIEQMTATTPEYIHVYPGAL